MSNHKAEFNDVGGAGENASRRARCLKLALFCAVVALGVVLVVLLLTPPAERSSAPTKSKPVPKKTAVPGPTVALATSPAEIPNEELQAELVQEIEALQSRFPQSPHALHVAAGAYVKLHQTARAGELWRKCIELNPRHLGPRLGLATLMSEKGEDAKAVEMLEKALAEGCSSAELYYRLASAHSKVGDVEKAEAVIQAGVEAFPGVAINWLLLGQTQNQLQQYEAAEQSLLKAVELGEKSSEVYFALANACQRQGKVEEATEYREQFSELKKKETGPSKGKPFQAIYQQALRPVVVSTLTSSAAIHAEQGRDAAAERLFLRANALAPDNRQVLDELVTYYRKRARGADAMVVQERLVELQPEHVIYHLNLASIASHMGDWKTAESALEHARKLAPDHVLPYIGLAQVRLQAGDLAEARQFAERSIERRPTAQGYAVLAVICERQGEMEAAKKARREAGRLASSGPRTVERSP
ncbi:MAG: tetratricopeptide repeat protein [Planctomycetota bacterium]